MWFTRWLRLEAETATTLFPFAYQHFFLETRFIVTCSWHFLIALETAESVETQLHFNLLASDLFINIQIFYFQNVVRRFICWRCLFVEFINQLSVHMGNYCTTPMWLDSRRGGFDLTRFTNACDLSSLLASVRRIFFTTFFRCVLKLLNRKQRMTHVRCACLGETLAIGDFALPAFSTHRYMGCVEWARLFRA